MSRHQKNRGQAAAGPTQRQLRAGELIRHALVEVLREEELQDPALQNVSVTVSEVRMSPDLKHAICFVEPLGAGIASADSKGGTGGEHAEEVVKGLNRVARFLRGRLGKHIDMKFTPDLKFIHDESFDTAGHMDQLFLDPRVQQDIRRLSDIVGDEED